jgi:signal transduction histidine kinase
MEDMEETNRQLVNIQEELEKSLKELREMDIKKDQFISIAAHELKTPLTSIHGFSQLLQNRKVSNNFTKRSKYLKIMDHETKRLAKLVNDILDLSRIDLGTVKFSLDGVDLNRLIEDVKKEMDVQINEKGLKSEYDVEKGMPKIITDREKLTEILLNIINNAVKYTPTGKISVKAFKEKEGVHFIIKDTGIGIAKENQKKIFERFYQVDSSYSRKAGGTGLGLALCSEFIGFLGGKLWIKSELGKGSEFHFTMPLKCAPKGRVEVERGKERLEKAKELSKGLEGAKDMSKSLEEMGIEKENPKAFQGNSNK